MPAATIIASTYNSPDWLQKVLWSFAAQTELDFEFIVADDGSGARTRELCLNQSDRLPYVLRHVWHPDEGFRKTEILNRAIAASRSDYLIFTDGDCLARADFVATHLRRRRANTFLSGGYFKLGRALSEAIGEEDIRTQSCFSLPWLRRRGHPRSIKNLKLTENAALARLLNTVTPTTPSWNGHNASTWKDLIVAANGFDTRMKYGGEDREFGERLANAGVRARQIRYSAVCLHLDHDRGYVTPEMIAANEEIREATRMRRRVRTSFGLAELD